MAPRPKPVFDPNDPIALRSFYEALRSRLSTERSSWDSHWQQLSSFFAPRTSRFNQDDANRGERKDFDIINETALLALRTLKAGMLTGMSSQTLTWFKLGAEDDELDEHADVRAWCDEVEERVRKVFIKSNVYQSLLTMYGEEGLYGTSCFLVEEDPKTVIRCRPYPIGSFYLMQDDTLRIDGCIRVVKMTVRQTVERFGYANCSMAMQTLYDSNAGGVKEDMYEIVHVLHKGSYFGPEKDGGLKPQMPWFSAWYELSAYNQKLGMLRQAGFLENPLICGRWAVTGENVYGESSAMDCLGSTMSLQCWEERVAQGVERGMNPTLLAGTDVDPRRFTTLPGDIIFADTKDVSNVMRPAYAIDFKLDHAIGQIQRIEARINDAMYRSLFQMFSESDRREITAEEIRARAAEKMQVLGPVIERNVEEVLSPLIQRTVGIMQRRGLLPPLPQIMQGRNVNIEFISILARAQKLSEVNNLTQYLGLLGSEAALNQGILDNVDLDAAARVAAEALAIPSKILRTADQVSAIRQDREQQQQQQIAADNAQKLASAANNLAQAKLGTGSALDATLPALAGGGE